METNRKIPSGGIATYLKLKYGSIQEAHDVWVCFSDFNGDYSEPADLEILDEYFSQFSDGMLRLFMLGVFNDQ